MSSQHREIYDGVDAIGDHSAATGGSHYHRQLLWQEIWEYVINECQARVARRRVEEGQFTTLNDGMSSLELRAMPAVAQRRAGKRVTTR